MRAPTHSWAAERAPEARTRAGRSRHPGQCAPRPPQLWAPHLSHATANDKGKETKSRATGAMRAQHIPPGPRCLQREAPPAEQVPTLLTCCLGPFSRELAQLTAASAASWLRGGSDPRTLLQPLHLRPCSGTFSAYSLHRVSQFPEASTSLPGYLTEPMKPRRWLLPLPPFLKRGNEAQTGPRSHPNGQH